MAVNNWNNNEPSFSYAGHSNLGVNLNRQKNAPLDISCEFKSVTDMLYYITEGRYPADGAGVDSFVVSMKKYPYLGQIIALVSTDPESVTLYYVKTAEYDATLTTDDEIFDHYFEELGKATLGDDKSIQLSSDGVLSLKNFGVKYYAYNSETGSYDSDPTDGWVDGLEPRVKVGEDGSTELVFYQPNPITVEGLNSSVTTLQGKVSTIETKIGDASTPDSIEGRLSDYGTRLSEAESNISNTYTKTETDTQISTAISNLGNVFELKASMTSEEFANASAESYDLGDVIIVDGSKEYVVVADGENKRFELLGDPSGVTALTTRVDGIDTRLTTAEGKITSLESADASLGERLTTAETKLATIDEGAEVNVIETIALDTDTTGEVTVSDKTATISIDKVASAVSADSAAKTDKTLTAGSKTFNGSTDVEITLDDLGGVASTKVAGETLGLVKSATGEGKVTVAEDGTMSVSKVSSAASADTATTADKVANALTITEPGKENIVYDGSEAGKIISLPGIADGTTAGLVKSSTGDGKVTIAADGTMSVSKVASATSADATVGTLTAGSKTFNGSSNVEITLTDLGFDPSDYATAEQGALADTSVQDVKLDDVSKVSIVDGKRVASITSEELKTSLGLGTAAYKAEGDFASSTEFNSLKEDALSKSEGGTVAGNTTFTGTVTVPAPSNDTDASTKKYVDDTITTKMAAIDGMTFKGLLGGESGISELPTVDVKNGDTYKVAAAGTYASQAAEVGDLFIALVTTSESGSTISWELVPSDDDGNVMANDTLVSSQLIIGDGSQSVKTLAAGTDSKILRMVDGAPAWSDELFTSVASSDNSITATKSEEDNSYDIKVNSVNVNLLTQTEGDTLILDGGSSAI